MAVALSARCVTRTLHSGPNPQRAVAPFTGSMSQPPRSSCTEWIASRIVLPDDTDVKGTPCPLHRIRILPRAKAIRPANIGRLGRACANGPASASLSRRRSKKKARCTATFERATSPTLQRISNRCGCDGLISWVDIVWLLSAADDYAAAESWGIGDSPEMRLLVGGGIGVDPETLQYRPQHDVHFGDRKIRPDAAACSASERQPCGCRMIGVQKAGRVETLGMRKDFRILVQIGKNHKHVATVRDSARTQIEVRCIDPSAGIIDDGANPQQLQYRRATEVASSRINLSGQFGQHVWVAPQPFKRPGKCGCCGFVTGTDEGHKFVADFRPRHPGSIGMPAAQQQCQDVGPLAECRIGLGPVDQHQYDAVEVLPDLVQLVPRAVATGPEFRRRHQLRQDRSAFCETFDDLTQFLLLGDVSTEDGPHDHVQGDPVHRFENPESFMLRPIRAFTQCLVGNNGLVILETPTAESWSEQPTPIVMPTAFQGKYRPGAKKVAQVQLIIGHAFRVRGAHRPHQSRVGNGDASAKEWNVELEDASMPLDPISHRFAAKQG